jgi:23S rRNA (adenine2503-C2)-methyltransferase
MPVNERYPLGEVIEAARVFYERRRRRVFIEYVMLAGVNDRYEQALALADLLVSPPPRTHAGSVAIRSPARGSIFKVNLIPYNPTGSAFRGSSPDSIAAFRAALEQRGVPCTVRLTRGRQIDAACGQLASRG